MDHSHFGIGKNSLRRRSKSHSDNRSVGSTASKVQLQGVKRPASDKATESEPKMYKAANRCTCTCVPKYYIDVEKKYFRMLINNLNAESNTKKAERESSSKDEEANQIIMGLRRNNERLETSLKSSEDLRRCLHETIQNLKGNIRVFCRVRPSINSEVNRMPCRIDFTDDTSLEIKKTEKSMGTVGKPCDYKQEFTFDRVFTPSSTQTEVFEDLSQLIQSALDGYNVCVFAYGQTGSGKTYTMQGYGNDLGMIPRSINLIFDKIGHMVKNGWECEVHASFLEIYNEKVRDLLDPANKDYKEIRYNGGKGASVTNLKIKPISSANVLHRLMEEAQTNRTVAVTNCNEHSSVSHAVTQIHLSCRYEASNTVYQSSLNLVDLAGSDSVKTSNADRVAETKHINKSLSTLGNVMLALNNKEKHVPYRDSKLTFLLQSCLGGNSKTLMFVNIAPFEDCCAESVNSLRFAAKVNQVQTNFKRNRLNK